MFKKLVLLNILVLCIIAIMASDMTQSMESSITASTDEATALDLIRQYAGQTEDIDDLRMLQNYWLILNPDECKAHFTDLKDKYPKQEKYLYLWARSTEDTSIRVQTGRQLIKKHPSFEYGYRLLLSYYQKSLFIYSDPDHPEAKPLIRDFKKDRKYFATYMKKFPDSEEAIYLNIALLVWDKKVTEANSLLARAVDMNASWLTWQYYVDFYFKTNQLLMLETYIRRTVATSSRTEHMTDEQKELQAQITYLGILFEGEANDEFFEYLKIHPQGLDISLIQRMYLLSCIKTGDTNRAFSFLNLLASQNNELYNWLLSDEELVPLRNDTRWDSLITQFKTNWEMSKESRRAEALSHKINKPAPLWELKDVEGNLIRLADLKGRVLILDFWATWCGPCQKAMVVLNKWMQTEIPIGVEVYSINVWENDPDAAAVYMSENNYAMTLLFGTDNLSADYGFDGIPYMCVIDRDGNIRYEEKGYAEDLAENLSFWIDDLN